MPKLTPQEKQPHESLVSVRNSIEAALECTRREAASIANQLTGEQCDKVIAADGDAKKIKAAIEPVDSKPQSKPEPQKTQSKN